MSQFERMAKLEESIAARTLGLQFRLAGGSDYAAGQSAEAMKREKAELFAMLDVMDFQQMRAYGEYRKAQAA